MLAFLCSFSLAGVSETLAPAAFGDNTRKRDIILLTCRSSSVGRAGAS